MENTNVNIKTLMVSLKPPRSCIITVMNIGLPHFSVNVDAHGGNPAVYVNVFLRELVGQSQIVLVSQSLQGAVGGQLVHKFVELGGDIGLLVTAKVRSSMLSASV